jgi:type I restriction enzyme M protein
MEDFSTNLDPSVKMITKQLWSTFDILRNEPIHPNEYHIILFFLILNQRTEFDNHDSNLTWKINNYFNELPTWEQDKLTEVYRKVYRKIIEEISYSGLRDIISRINFLDQGALSTNFTEIFDETLYYLAKSQGRDGGEAVLPFEISKLMMALANPQTGDEVYNPFAGLASFGVFLPTECSYYGQELNQTTWAIGTLRILAYRKQDLITFNYNQNDSIEFWGLHFENDLVISSPPLNQKLKPWRNDKYPELKTIEEFLIRNGIDTLSTRGKLVALISPTFLYSSGSSYSLREYLIENDLIDTIVSLPGGLLLDTGIPSIVLVLNKKKLQPGKIKFVDASNYTISESGQKKKLNWIHLFHEIQNEDNRELVQFATIEKIKKEDFNLQVTRYFKEEVDGTPLGEILQIIPLTNASEDLVGPYVRIGDLKEDPIDYTLKSDEILFRDLPNQKLFEINESCILLAIRWKTLKPTFFKFEGQPILISRDILPCKVNSSEVSIGYLINELQKDYVENQLKSFQIGTIVPSIKRDDLMKVKVHLIPIEEQNARSKGLEQLSLKFFSLQKERDSLIVGKKEESFNEFASLKHTLGRPRQNILDWSDNILAFLMDHKDEIEVLNTKFKEFYEVDLFDAVGEIKSDINLISELLEKGENGLVLQDYEKALISLKSINSLLGRITSSGYNFKLNKVKVSGIDLDKRGIEINEALLKVLIGNILINANKHGFKENRPSNEVVIEFIDNQDYLHLEIRNNGMPFPKNINKEKFTTKFFTTSKDTGTGLGGYDIDRIAKYFGENDWELDLGDPIYPIKFKFKFQIKSFK